MHPISFAFKRAHLSCVAFGSAVVKRVRGMTPAAFDVMFAIRTSYGVNRNPKGVWPEVERRTLWKALGLHPSTISKLLKRLRLLGWIRNDERGGSDGRTKRVRLTETGRRRIDRAMRIVFQQHTHLKEFERFFKRRGPRELLEVLVDYTSELRAIGSHFGDSAREVLYTFDYDPLKPLPDYLEWEMWRNELRRADASDWTSYRDAHKCATSHHCGWAMQSANVKRKVRLTSAISRRRRCFVALARMPDRPESRLVIMMMSRCAADEAAHARGEERHRLDCARRFAEKEKARRMAEDPWFAAFEEARDTEERHRAGDPHWYIPRDLLELMERSKEGCGAAATASPVPPVEDAIE